jgi:hypothetical protein
MSQCWLENFKSIFNQISPVIQTENSEGSVLNRITLLLIIFVIILYLLSVKEWKVILITGLVLIFIIWLLLPRRKIEHFVRLPAEVKDKKVKPSCSNCHAFKSKKRAKSKKTKIKKKEEGQEYLDSVFTPYPHPRWEMEEEDVEMEDAKTFRLVPQGALRRRKIGTEHVS